MSADLKQLERFYKDKPSILTKNILKGLTPSRFLDLLCKRIYAIEQGELDLSELKLANVTQGIEQGFKTIMDPRLNYLLMKVNLYVLIKTQEFALVLDRRNPVAARIFCLLSALGFRSCYFYNQALNLNKSKLEGFGTWFRNKLITTHQSRLLSFGISDTLSRGRNDIEKFNNSEFRNNPWQEIDNAINSLSTELQVKPITKKISKNALRTLSALVQYFSRRCANLANNFYLADEGYIKIRLKTYRVDEKSKKRQASIRRIEGNEECIQAAQAEAVNWAHCCTSLLIQYQNYGNGEQYDKMYLEKLRSKDQMKEPNPKRVQRWLEFLETLSDDENTLIVLKSHFEASHISTVQYISDSKGFQNIEDECKALHQFDEHHFKNTQGEPEERLAHLEIALVKIHFELN